MISIELHNFQPIEPSDGPRVITIRDEEAKVGRTNLTRGSFGGM